MSEGYLLQATESGQSGRGRSPETFGINLMPAPRIPRTGHRSKPKPSLRRRAQHLAFVRLLTCVACGCRPLLGIQAAHVRSGTDGGIGMKPSDRYAVPLCTGCHGDQHRVGELSFWAELGIDPLDTALRLWTISGDVEAGERAIFRARQQINLVRA